MVSLSRMRLSPLFGAAVPRPEISRLGRGDVAREALGDDPGNVD
jgi:hypothetical protein